MKKYIGIILAVIAFIINILCFWYADTLFNRYFVFGLIPLGLAIFILIVSVIVSFVLIIHNTKKFNPYISLAISVITIILIFVFPFRMAKVNFELNLLENDRLQVIEMVANGDIIVDSIGNAALPQKYKGTSSDGNIFVYQNDEEQVVSFWVFRGMLSGSVELIYSSQDESLIYENETGHPITSVMKLKEHWYLVETDY